MRAHCANGISAHRSLRDETVVIYIYLWQNYYSLLSPHISHSRFRKRRKGTSLLVSPYLSNKSFGKILRETGQQSTSALELN